MAEGDTDLIISDLSGGRNGVDAPTSDQFPFNQSVLAENLDYRNGGLGRRRGGSADVISTITLSGLGANPVGSLFRHDPGNDLTTWEMMMWDTGNVFTRLPVGTVCANPSASAGMAFTGAPTARKLNAVSFNGKLFLFYTEADLQDRIKVLDPTTNAYRYVGAAPGAVAPTAADTGGGGLAAVQRWYRVRWLQLSGSVIIRRSEPTPSVSFVPSGAGAAVRTTRPALPAFDSGYTHWELEGSPDNVFFYCLAGSLPGSPSAAVAIATTFLDNTAAPSTYPTTMPLSHPLGTYTLIPRAKFGVTDGNRLVVANFDLDGLGSRVGWTPVLGSLDAGDDERFFQTATIKPYIDLNTKNGGDITGSAQTQGVIYQFKMKEVWRMTPTTSLEAPYVVRRISRTVGAVHHRSIVEGEDASGSPCVYFMSHKGPYRVGPNGLEYLGRDIEDATRTLAGAPNINTTATVIAHSVFHGDVGQWWLWFSTGVNDTPNRLFIFDVKRGIRRDNFGVRGGWTEFTGDIAAATCSAMGPYKLAATINYRPWIALAGNAKVSICDRDDITTDNGTAFLARVKTRSVYRYGKLLKIGEIAGIVRHGVAGGVSLRATVDQDFGQGTQSIADGVSGAATDVYLPIKFDAAKGADAIAVQIQIAEVAAQAGYWEMIGLKVPVFVEGDI